MSAARVSCLLVVERGGDPIGVLSRTDLLHARHGAARLIDLHASRVSELMTLHIDAIDAARSIAEAAQLLVDRRIHRAFVRERGAITGVTSTKEVMRALMAARVSAPLSAYMSRHPVTADVTEPVGRVLDRLAHAHIGGVVVTDQDAPVGVFTQIEALEARSLPPEAAVEEAMSQAMLCLPATTPIFRAAGFSLATRARRVLAVEHHAVVGILTGLDFARAALGEPPPAHAAAGAG
jgi:CBS domain-containing protein